MDETTSVRLGTVEVPKVVRGMGWVVVMGRSCPLVDAKARSVVVTPFVGGIVRNSKVVDTTFPRVALSVAVVSSAEMVVDVGTMGSVGKSVVAVVVVVVVLETLHDISKVNSSDRCLLENKSAFVWLYSNEKVEPDEPRESSSPC